MKNLVFYATWTQWCSTGGKVTYTSRPYTSFLDAFEDLKSEMIRVEPIQHLFTSVSVISKERDA